jgi:hypothetical protein
LAKQDKIEAGEGLDGRMVGDVAVYLAAGIVAQGIVVAGVQSFFIDEGDVPECEVTDDVLLYCFLHFVPLMDKSREWQVGTLADSHYCPREIDVLENVLHVYRLSIDG